MNRNGLTETSIGVQVPFMAFHKSTYHHGFISLSALAILRKRRRQPDHKSERNLSSEYEVYV
jgi:hypothetical protein